MYLAQLHAFVIIEDRLMSQDGRINKINTSNKTYYAALSGTQMPTKAHDSCSKVINVAM